MATNGNTKQLTPAQQRFLTALLDVRNRSVKAAAKASDTPHRTAVRWMASDDFKQALDGALASAMDELTRQLVTRLQPSADVVAALAFDSNQPAGIRLRAASAIIDVGLRVYEGRQLERRLSALEQAINNEQ